MDLSWTTDHRDGVTLVACRLRNPAPIARRVRVANNLDGPVLPPRSHGEPLPGWDADGVTLRVEPEGTAAVGYAVPAPTTAPPASVAFDEPAREETADGTPTASLTEEGTTAAAEPTATDAIRTLGAYRPPRAVVSGPSDQLESGPPTATPNAGGTDVADGDTPSDIDSDSERPNDAQRPTTTSGTHSAPSCGTHPTTSTANPPTTSQADPPTASPADPAAVDAWLDAVERRVARAEQLDGADVPTATEAVAAAGGLGAVRELDGKIDDDAERLRTVAERAATLADRAAEVEVPTEPLGRLA